jgi:hypothetical protein
MKKNVIAVFIISLITVSFLSLAISAALKKTNEKFFYGRVIFVSDNYIELKKGKSELVIYFTDSSMFISKDGKESAKNIVSVCQYVEAYYADGAKKTLNRIIVKKDSDCVK